MLLNVEYSLYFKFGCIYLNIYRYVNVLYDLFLLRVIEVCFGVNLLWFIIFMKIMYLGFRVRGLGFE